jgi:hypothetical protein
VKRRDRAYYQGATLKMHAYPLSSGSIECYVSSAKELDHDRHDAGRSVA